MNKRTNWRNFDCVLRSNKNECIQNELHRKRNARRSCVLFYFFFWDALSSSFCKIISSVCDRQNIYWINIFVPTAQKIGSGSGRVLAEKTEFFIALCRHHLCCDAAQVKHFAIFTNDKHVFRFDSFLGEWGMEKRGQKKWRNSRKPNKKAEKMVRFHL